MKAVYYGKESLSNYIKHVNIPNYRIYIGERNSTYNTPIFSSLTNNIKTALNDFNNFSENILLGNPTDDTVYYIKFYKDGSDIKKHLNESFFALNKEVDQLSGIGTHNGSMGEIIGLMNSIMPMAKAQAENELLRDRILDLEEQEEPETNTIATQIISGLAAVLPQLLGGGSSGVQIAGTDTITEKKSLLDKAIAILSKHDKEIETDLYKLSQIAEQKPEQFNMLINMLRSM